jgi:hypothetical protein
MTFPIQYSMSKKDIDPTKHNFHFVLNKILIQKKRVRQVDREYTVFSRLLLC